MSGLRHGEGDGARIQFGHIEEGEQTLWHIADADGERIPSSIRVVAGGLRSVIVGAHGDTIQL